MLSLPTLEKKGAAAAADALSLVCVRAFRLVRLGGGFVRLPREGGHLEPLILYLRFQQLSPTNSLERILDF